jgi:UDPglucose 6-dehydrogenase
LQHRIAVIGSGYVGTVAAACFAYIGHNVIAVESDAAKLGSLSDGRAPFYEPGLDALLGEGLGSGLLSFTSDFADAMSKSDVVFICVGTPSAPDGQPDVSAVKAVAHSLAGSLNNPHIIVNKSTVPIGTGRWLLSMIQDEANGSLSHAEVTIVSNPEFLREGTSVSDFLHPDRIVLGSDNHSALDVLTDLYAPILQQRLPGTAPGAPTVPLVRTSLAAAEMIKYASNAFLATKISFANEMARICDLVGADITEVTAGMGLDERIGPRFLNAGLGWGGSCFPKDILALIKTASEYGYAPRILKSALEVNDDQRRIALEVLLRYLKIIRGARIGVLGIAFKPNTDDVRDSAALEVIRMLSERDAVVVAYDPMIPDIPGVRTVSDPYEVANGADAIILATAWPEFLALDLDKLRARANGNLFFDGRNVLDPSAVRRAGFHYIGIGRASASSTEAMADRADPEFQETRG